MRGDMMWYENAVKELETGKRYRRAEIIAALQQKKGGLSDNSYIWLIGDLVKDGVLRHEGRNQYALSDEHTKEQYVPSYSKQAQSIKSGLKKKYPRIIFTVFESTLLNEFLNHQIARNTIFVQVEKDVGGFVFDYLRETDTTGNVLYRPTKKEYSRYWKPGTLIVTDCTSEAPLNKESPHEITAEKLLVDIFCDKTIRLTYSEAEYQTIVGTMYERYSVDTVKLLRYARRRNKSKEIEEIIRKAGGA